VTRTNLYVAALIVVLCTVLALVIVETGPGKDKSELLAASSATYTPCDHHYAGRGCQDWQWRWKVWLPDKWARIGACETGYGQRPGRWDWNSGTYQGAFGFHHDSWDHFKPVAWWPREAYLASPWQQYRTALAIHARYGLSGWGCRGA
jgi:hypothetical protein